MTPLIQCMEEQSDNNENDPFTIDNDFFLQQANASNLNNTKQYLSLEEWFQEVAEKNKLTPAKLDALIWQRYSGTPWENFKW